MRAFIVLAMLVGLLPGCVTTGSKYAASVSPLKVDFAFDGGGCLTSGPSPEIHVVGVPTGTKQLKARMVDLDSVGYNHGGGSIVYAGGNRIPAGALSSYKGPCPPAGQSHTYEITVQALDAQGVVIGEGKARSLHSR